MARPLRVQKANAVYHVTSRGVKGKNIFLDREDRLVFLKFLKECGKKFNVDIFVFVLMTNHFHILLKTFLPNISRFMQVLQTKYAMYFNLKYQQKGHLFQGRFLSLMVEKETYFFRLVQYILLNPIRAGIIKRLEDYEWSTFQEIIGTTDFGISDTRDIVKHFPDIASFVKFCYDGTAVNWNFDFQPEIYGEIVLGSKEYTDALKKEISSEVIAKNDVASIRKLKFRISKDMILKTVDDYYTVGKHYTIKHEKLKLTIYFLHKLTDMKLKAIGSLFKKHAKNVSKICREIDDLLDLKNNEILLKRLDDITQKINEKVESRGLTQI